MPVYFEYMLKASACLAIIYLFYVLLLRRLTYYTLNRYFMLIYCMLACIIPLLKASVFIKSDRFNNIAFFDRFPSLSNNAVTANKALDFREVDVTSLITYIFVLGLCVMFIRLFIQLLSLWKMHLKATLLQDGKIKIYHINEGIIPFSYFNNIYLNKDNYSEDELTEIVKHEMVHVQQKHAIDILITEIICLFNWYNPIVWLLKKAIKENLEFIADDVVIKKGADKKNYQYLLLKVTGDVSFSMANNLNFSSLKNRISMMNKSRTNRFHLLKFIVLIPTATVLLLAFRNKQQVPTTTSVEHRATTKTYVLSSLTYDIEDKKVEAVVKGEQQKSLFKAGQAINLDLDLFLREHDRLRDLLQESGYKLEETGYNNSGKYGIIFMIDTTLGNNNLSVQVNINLSKKQLRQGSEELSKDKATRTPGSAIERSTNTTTPVSQANGIQASNNKDLLVSATKAMNGNLFAIR